MALTNNIPTLASLLNGLSIANVAASFALLRPKPPAAVRDQALAAAACRRCQMTTARESTSNCEFPHFGTRSVQLSERKSGGLLPKRHQIKHLEFVISWFGTRGSEVQILSPRPSFISVVTSSLTDCISVWLRGSKKRESGENTKPSGKRAV